MTDAASASTYSVEAGASRSREHLIGQKVWLEDGVQSEVKKIVEPVGGSDKLQALNAYIF